MKGRLIYGVLGQSHQANQDLTLQKRLQRTFLARQKIPISGTLAIHGQLKPYPRRMLKITAKTWRKTSIDLICKDTEEARVDVMKTFGSSVYYTSLYSKCACPGRCSGLSSGAIAGIVIGSIVAFLILVFVVFICYVRCMLADVETKPSLWTTIKDGFILIKQTCCPCFRRRQYSQIP